MNKLFIHHRLNRQGLCPNCENWFIRVGCSWCISTGFYIDIICEASDLIWYLVFNPSPQFFIRSILFFFVFQSWTKNGKSNKRCQASAGYRIWLPIVYIIHSPGQRMCSMQKENWKENIAQKNAKSERICFVNVNSFVHLISHKSNMYILSSRL